MVSTVEPERHCRGEHFRICLPPPKSELRSFRRNQIRSCNKRGTAFGIAKGLMAIRRKSFCSKSADGGTRTHTSFGTLDFESSASASSATSARKSAEGHHERGTFPRQAPPLSLNNVSFESTDSNREIGLTTEQSVDKILRQIA